MSALRICVVYPDLLGTYGDGGNGEILARRAGWRGIETELLLSHSSDALPPADLYCLGGGEDGPQVLAAQRLSDEKAFAAAVDDGAVVFAVCAGFQILGRSFPDASGATRDGLGLLAMETTKFDGVRAVGEVAVTVGSVLGSAPLGLLSGFENHAGATRLDGGLSPFGEVCTGYGNSAEMAGAGPEGALDGRIVGTYLHGPVLARNPNLADALLAGALGGIDLTPLDDAEATSLRTERLSALGLSA